jgi:hypothetical protein
MAKTPPCRGGNPGSIPGVGVLLLVQFPKGLKSCLSYIKYAIRRYKQKRSSMGKLQEK